MKELFTNTRLKKIVNVYQLQYPNRQAPGFGDYLRGCYCVYQLCKYIDIEFGMIINHPMSKYLINHQILPEDISYENIYWVEGDNFSEETTIFFTRFINYINGINQDTLYMFSHAFPIWRVQSESMNFIRKSIIPTDDMKNYVTQILTDIGMPFGGYSIVHIRTGDNHLLNGKRMEYTTFSKISSILKKYTNSQEKYIVLSDNNNFKLFLSQRYNRFVCYNKEITHLGENTVKTDEGVKNTLLDFFIMSRSSNIISMTPYEHGTGFSKWCATTYGIPYICLKI